MTKKPTQSEMLIRYAEEALEMFHVSGGKAYVTIQVDGRVETWPVRSRQFNRYLRWRFYQDESKAPNAQAITDATATISARAEFEGLEKQVHIRVAKHDEDTVYVDLSNDAREAVEITSKGWQVVPSEAVPMKFVHSDNAAALPHPVTGGTLEILRRFLNLRNEEDFRLFVAWVVAAYSPDGPYPVLVLQGEQGSAKSTTVRVARSLTDPAVEPLRAPPRDTRDLAIAASGNWTPAFDNLSGMNTSLSDALCRLATGGGFATRELYTDDQEVMLKAKRPVVLNGIDSLAEKGDLRHRSLIIELPPIPPGKRRTEREFYGEFELVRPQVLGTVFDTVSAALRNRDKVTFEELPRMADFAEWVTAAEEALPWEPGAFMEAYSTNSVEANATAIDVDPLAVAVQEFMAGRQEWSGTALELFNALSQLVDEDVCSSKTWPGAANSMSNHMKRIAPALREVGIEYGDKRSPGGNRTRRKSLKKTGLAGRPGCPANQGRPAVHGDEPRTTAGGAEQGWDRGDGRDDSTRPDSGRERFVL